MGRCDQPDESAIFCKLFFASAKWNVEVSGMSYAKGMSHNPKNAIHHQGPYPDYPYGARALPWTGAGVYVVRFARDGHATKAVTLKSTGRANLDDACLSAFRRWQCQPGLFDTVKIPVTFTMDRRTH